MARSPNMSGSRRLLARVRDTMAGAGTAQERLDRIATTIAADLVAEVCSIYVLRAGEVLELFANTGLTPEAVHLTRLNIGEGLIGVIAQRARPLALTNLQDHPAYAYRPETGEERYHSLAGVPILRDGRVTGVLAIQNRTQRQYTEEELETLETIAMVVAELIAGGELITSDELQAIEGLTMLPVSIEGVRLNGGLAIGTALRHERRISIDKLVAEDTDEEKRRFVGALGEMHGAIDKMLAASDMASGGEHREILETYRMFAEDAGWLARIHEAIETGLTAEAAVIKVRNDTRVRFRQQTDPYLRERLHDFEDLANRLLMHLAGDPDPAPKSAGPADIILFARNMGPAELLDYGRSHLKGLVLEEGSATTHVAIVAKALDIPVIGRAGDVMGVVENNDRVVLDGDNAEVHIRPSEEALQSFADTLNQRQQRIAAYSSLLDVPAETKDGLRMSLNINAGLFVDVQNMLDTGADGIGLYRTEIPFMESSDFPDVDRQAELYKRIIDQSAGKPVIFRTLDVGGDKGLPYWKMDEGENPAMGWRAVRVALDRPVLLRHQFRALIRAADGRDLKIMFPMITEVAEFDALRDILMREMRTAEKRGRKLPGALQVGTMLEVPALAFQMKSLLQRVDFVSVGSNDLFQFLFASDRGNPLLADRYDPLSPPALTLLGDLVRQCDDAGIPISLCGEIAGRPLDAMALVGLGFRNLSMAPSSIGPVKAMVRSLSVSDLKRYLDTLLQSHEHSLREKLREFAVDHGVII
ncbi:MAG: phosphoenolpyruvate--protein phosphotransferase [Rhodospirillaceae bacterium]|nr:phosphoenolpyruvate--protein phosphotransferase [Rhodospirillaceae bacterium]